MGGLFASTFRALVAGTLGYSGALWLCNTIGLKDLILNAAALAFVLDIDKMLFSTLVPRRACEILGKLEPLKWQGADLGHTHQNGPCDGTSRSSVTRDRSAQF